MPIERIAVGLTVNGCAVEQLNDPCAMLLDVLHELGLTGTKKACEMGACGACTVLADGRRIVSCLALAASYAGATITTIEGVGTPDALHPLQEAFVDHDALQCGYCTPGQIMSALGLIAEGCSDRATIREGLSGNLCRCGAYPRIVAAVAEAAGL